MFRLLSVLFWLVVAIVLVVIGFANYEMVTITLLPEEFVPFVGFNYTSPELPMSIVFLGIFVTGFALGFIWDWIREGKHRSEAVRNRRDKAVLEQELKKLKTETNRHEGKDEILALLEPSRNAS